MREEPIKHPELAKYPDRPTHVIRRDGVLYEVPYRNTLDEAVPVPVTDLVHAVAAIHQLRQLVDKANLTEFQLECIGGAIVVTTNDPSPTTRREVSAELGRLIQRIRGWQPYW